MNNLDFFMEYLPFFIPLIILQLILAVTALIHVIKHPQYRFGNKGLWIVIVLAFQIVGPVIYFTLGKGENI
ncbi:PLD nuclease N-terminal domain-containing protein [Paenibacillus turicensis]|uniref:PLD nuclease N-terminal domain-containing protein n=1 Tax=Paenibacillus turicensis TaxID=160487 RepID=UPI003D2D85E6